LKNSGPVSIQVIAQATNSIVNSMASSLIVILKIISLNMTLTKLSLNQDLAIESSAMQMNFRKTNASSFTNNLKMSQGSISVPSSLCDSFQMDPVSCSNNLITSQVNLQTLRGAINLIFRSFIVLDIFDGKSLCWFKYECERRRI